MALASMGVYVFDTAFLFDQLRRDAADALSSHDFGKDIIPYVVRHGSAVAHHFSRSCVRTSGQAATYWRDVGTLDAYWAANMDLTDIVPQLDLYDRNWPIWTFAENSPPAKFVHDQDARRGQAISSLVSGGCIVSGATVRQSLLFTRVHVRSFSEVENAVILPDVDIGREARLKNVIVDRGVRIPGKLVVGENPEFDASRFRRTESGICLITQAMIDRLVDDGHQGPRGRLGNLSPRQDRRSCRRGGCAAAGLQPGSGRGDDAGAGLSRGEKCDRFGRHGAGSR